LRWDRFKAQEYVADVEGQFDFDLHRKAAGVVGKPDEESAFAAEESSVVDECFVADGVETAGGGGDGFELLGFDAGFDKAAAVAEGDLGRGAWGEGERAEMAEAENHVVDAGWDGELGSFREATGEVCFGVVGETCGEFGMGFGALAAFLGLEQGLGGAVVGRVGGLVVLFDGVEFADGADGGDLERGACGRKMDGGAAGVEQAPMGMEGEVLGRERCGGEDEQGKDEQEGG
jgi:hypothetical protein